MTLPTFCGGATASRSLHSLLSLVAVCLSCAAVLPRAAAQMIDWEAAPLTKVQINTVRFRGWTPPAVEKLKGTLVLIPGRHGDGRGMAENGEWQLLAREVGFAILACQFSDGEKGLYQQDEKGDVARAINQAVETLADKSGHPELSTAPLAFWGTSAGSNVSSRYCVHFPKRVIAFASSKGTCGPGHDINSANTKIPMFFAIGKNDKPDWVSYSLNAVRKGQGQRAPWTVAFSRSEGHGVGKSLSVARPFLRAAIQQRLGDAPVTGSSSSGSFFKSKLPMAGTPSFSPSKASARLEAINLRDGWLGDTESFEVAPYNEFKGSKSRAQWLPDEATALAWSQYLKS